ncbi:hypothetical protein F5B22DRAFT_592515 [Xylaria bambusicola]|uniref:uncharacterized protein n=1 Tax=Xylaria bambusicola TaxID=326684 RepID=UPI0020086308|nr:uncharacterized protein F5B22DRAFT_592515 [Xylaria bambusicola]KAI0523924.1 hypothetical protein F5B22DRAFT_592515 [Xylaria bambusicola]
MISCYFVTRFSSPKMRLFVAKVLVSLLLFGTSTIVAQGGDGYGYFGYELHKRGDPESTNYETASTPGVDLPVTPDVFLNATVSVGEIDIEVDNITAKINLDAKVLNLLHFTAGVDASINRVRLSIQDVKAKVLLEARLGNVVQMVGDVLNVIDLNPIVATLGQGVGDIVGNLTDDLGGTTTTTSAESSATNAKRSLLDYNIQHNILYSINDYSGNTHTNRKLGQDGTLYDVSLDNDGNEHGEKAVGYYKEDMTFTGHNRSITVDDKTEFELGYMYAPFPGLEIVAYIYTTPEGQVVKTQMIAEAEGGGTSTISDDEDQ